VEVRSSLKSRREARLLFGHFSEHAALVIAVGFIKKSQKTPKDVLDLARKRLREFQP
jgi:phage-related protein